MSKENEILNGVKNSALNIADVMQRFFWWNVFGATLVLPILPLISAYREWKFIEWQKDFECSKWIADFKIKEMWWKLLKTHYQSWYEKLRWYKAEREKMRLSNVA